MENFITTEHDQHIAVISLNRPEKSNALHGDMIKQLLQSLHHEDEREETKVIVLKGEGKHFCAGADIRWMQTLAAGSYEINYDDAQLIADLMYRLYTLKKPSIVLAHGAVMGGGLGLVAACDIAIASDDAKFAFSEVKIGITPSTISPYIIAAIGERAAHYYFLTGRQFDANEAHHIGLLHKTVASETLLESGMQIAREICENPRHAVVAAKQLIRHVVRERISDTLGQKTAEHLANLRSSPEGKACLQAFIDKRLGQSSGK